MHRQRVRKHGHIEASRPPRDFHGESRNPVYRVWLAMVQRCHNPKNRHYINYGARGIRVCKRYQQSFRAFYEDIGPRPKGMTVDRENNDGHYSCGKCEKCRDNGWAMNIRWANRHQQILNRRLSSRNNSGYRGVHWKKDRNKWSAATSVAGGITIFMGYFLTPEEAASAYDQYAIQLFGEDAKPNFEYFPVLTQ